MKQVTQTWSTRKSAHEIARHKQLFSCYVYILKIFSLFFLVDTAKTPFIDQTTSKDANEIIIAAF